MKKLSRKIILATLGVLCGVCCAFGGVAAFSQETAVSVAAETTNAPTVSYSGVSTFHNIAGRCDTLITFSENLDGASGTPEATNYAATSNATSLGVKLNGRTFYELYQENSSFHIYYGYGGSIFCFIVPDSYLVATAEYPEPVLTIDVGTPFVAQYLPATTLYYCNGYWLEAAPVTTATVSYSGIHATFNNYTGNGVGRYDTIIEFSANLGSAADATNLAATLNRTSLGVKLNGKTFYELYKENSQFNINYGYGATPWFVFIIPDSYFVAAEGASEPVLTIDEGTPFMGSYLPAVELHGNLTTKTWYKYEKINDTPDFVSSRSSNPSDGWPFYGVYLKYNTSDFLATEGQVVVSGSTGFTFNGAASNITNIVFNGKAAGENDELLFWLSSDKCVADYNGYSHPTLEIAEGATVTNAAGQTFTLKALTLYLVDGAWTTTKPADYYIGTKLTYSTITWNNIDYSGKSYNDDTTIKALILITYSDLIKDASGNAMTTTENVVETYGDTIKLGDTPLKDVEGARIFVFNGHITIVVPFGDKLVIEDKTDFYGYILEGKTFYLDISQKTQLLNSGIWSDTEPSYTDVTFSALTWNNYDFNGYAQAYCGENSTGTPVKGFCGLLSYRDNLAANSNDVININMATKYFDIGGKLKVNGVAAKDIEGAYISYNAAHNHLYFYMPYSGLTAADMYTVTIEAGARFMGVTLPATTYYFYDGTLNDTAANVVSIYKDGAFVTNKKIGDGLTVTAAWLAEILGNAQYPVSWTIGETTYYAGDSVAVTATSTLTVTEAVTFETMSGASVRMATSGMGIRFGSTLSLADYNALVAKYGADNVKTGTLIAPRYLFDKDGKTIEAYFAQAQGTGADQKYVNVVNTTADGKLGIYNGNTYETDGYIRFYGALTELNESNYYTKFFGVGYVEIIVSAGKTVRVYGLTNANKTTRTMYDVAAAAYNDSTASYNYELLKPYLNSVVKLAYTNGNLTVDSGVADGRNGYSVPYSVTMDADGNFTVTSSVKPTKILVNGLVALSDVTETNGTFSFVLPKDGLSAYGSTMRYGLAEPCYSLWNDGVASKTSTALSKVAGKLGVTSYRVWLDGSVATVNSSNTVTLSTMYFAKVKTHVKDLVNAGINEICFYNGCAITPYGGQSGAVPDPSTAAEDYATWLKVQYNYYNAFAQAVNCWYSSESWTADDVKFYFEGVNEPEFQNVIYKRGALSEGTYATEYFSTTELAQVLTDWSYYMTLAVNTHLSGKGFVTTPAFTYLSSGSGDTSVVNGVYCDTLLAAMYAKINDDVAPTAISGVTQSNAVSEINSYFTCLNWHPYLPWFKSEHAEMYYGEIVTKTFLWNSTKEAVTNTNYAQQWAAWNETMYAIATSNGDTDSPKVFFSEFGICDFGNPTSGNYKLMGIGEELSATVFKTLMEKAQSLSFANQLTIMEFRLLDGSNQFGMIDEDGTIKPIMTAYFEIINGDESIAELQAAVNEYFGSTTSGN